MDFPKSVGFSMVVFYGVFYVNHYLQIEKNHRAILGHFKMLYMASILRSFPVCPKKIDS